MQTGRPASSAPDRAPAYVLRRSGRRSSAGQARQRPQAGTALRQQRQKQIRFAVFLSLRDGERKALRSLSRGAALRAPDHFQEAGETADRFRKKRHIEPEHVLVLFPAHQHHVLAIKRTTAAESRDCPRRAAQTAHARHTITGLYEWFHSCRVRFSRNFFSTMRSISAGSAQTYHRSL